MHYHSKPIMRSLLLNTISAQGGIERKRLERTGAQRSEANQTHGGVRQSRSLAGLLIAAPPLLLSPSPPIDLISSQVTSSTMPPRWSNTRYVVLGGPNPGIYNTR